MTQRNPLYDLELVKRRLKSMRRKKIIAYIIGGFAFALFVYTLYEYVHNGFFGIQRALLYGFIGLVVGALYCVVVIYFTQSGVSMQLLSAYEGNDLNQAIETLNQVTVDNQFAYGMKRLYLAQRVIKEFDAATLRGVLIRSIPRISGIREEGIVEFYFEKSMISVICKRFNMEEASDFQTVITRDFKELPVVIYHEDPKRFKAVRKQLKRRHRNR